MESLILTTGCVNLRETASLSLLLLLVGWLLIASIISSIIFEDHVQRTRVAIVSTIRVKLSSFY